MWQELWSRGNDKDPSCATGANKVRTGQQSLLSQTCPEILSELVCTSLSASHTVHGQECQSLKGQELLQKGCLFYFHNSGADKRLP